MCATLTDVSPVVKDLCRWKAAMEHDLIDKNLQDPSGILKFEVMQFLSPVTACIIQIWFQVCMLGFGIWLLVESYLSISTYSTYGLSRYKSVKLDMTIKGHCNDEFYKNALGIEGELTMLRAGCRVASENFTVKFMSTLSPLIFMQFPDLMELDGFSVKLLPTNISACLRFIVRGSAGPSDGWALFGQTTDLRKVGNEIRFIDSNDDYLVTGLATYDFRAPWPLFAETSMTYIVLCCSCLLVAVMGFRKNHPAAKVVLLATMLLLALVTCIAGAGYCSLGMFRESFTPLLDTAIYLLLFESLKCKEKWFFDILVAVAVVGLIGACIQDCALFHDCSHLLKSPPAKFIIFAILGSAFLAFRKISVLSAARAVSADTAQLNTLWHEVQQSREEAEALHDIAAAALRLADSCDPAQARQFNRLRRNNPAQVSTSDLGPTRPRTPSSPACESLPPQLVQRAEDPYRARVWSDHAGLGEDDAAVDTNYNTLSGTCDFQRPVRSLDQLYNQALCASAALLAHATLWAANAGGVLDVDPPSDELCPSEPDLLDSACAGLVPSSAIKLIRRRMMKAPVRAIEKVLACYAGDVSRVLDICRCRVLFASAQGIRRCLELVNSDLANGVRIVRIKNGMDDRNDAWQTAGFRVVVLNLSFNFEEMRSLGVENHVCELQMVLETFATKVADNLSHSRFLRFRAVRDHAWILRMLQSRSSFSGLIWPEPIPKSTLDRQNVMDAVNTSPVSSSAHKGDELPHRHYEGRAGTSLGELNKMSGFNTSSVETKINIDTILEQRSEFQQDESTILRIPNIDPTIPVQVYVRSALNPGSVLDHQVAQVVNAVEHSSSGAIWFTSTPLAAASSRLVFQIAFLGFVVLFLFHAVSFYEECRNNGEFKAISVRLDILESANPSKYSMNEMILDFGLLHNGCNVYGGSLSLIDNVSALRKYDSTVSANGYYFITSPSSGQDRSVPIRWVVKAQASSTNDTSSWITVAASGWQYGSTGGMILLSQLPYEFPLNRGEAIVVDNRLSWPALLSSSSGGIEWAVGLGLCVIMARLGFLSWVRMCFVCCSFFDVLLLTVAAIGFHTLGFNRAAIENWLGVWALLTLAVGIFYFEAQMVHVFIIYGLQYWLIIIATYVAIYWRSWTEAAFDLLPSVGTATFVFGLFIHYFRRRALIRARQLVQSDMEKYNIIWSEVQNTEGAVGKLHELQQLVSSVSHSKTYQRPRQLKVLSAQSSKRRISRHSSTMFEYTSPVKSLDQLFVHSMCIHPILLHKVKTWAATNSGCFPADVSNGETCIQKKFVTLDIAQSDSYASAKFAKVKSVTRALEKLGRSYGQDVSQLLDVCRQGIVFDNIGNLVSCLLSLIEDKEVIILRIKNRLDHGYDASSSAGYRDVALNLRIESAETIEIGVQMHVCELQLVLTPFAEIKSDEGHKRYVEFRNLRGE